MPPRQSKSYGVRIVEPILEAMGIVYHNIEEDADVAKIRPAIDKAFADCKARRSPDRTEAEMMDRKKTLAAIARHVTDADIVLPVYSTRVRLDRHPAEPAQLSVPRRDGACLVACARASRSAAPTSG